jgi:hypothetical protein
MDVIKLYSDLGALEKILEAVNEQGRSYSETTSDVQKSVATVSRQLLANCFLAQGGHSYGDTARDHWTRYT